MGINDSHVMKILVPIDGSTRSLKPIYHANYLFRDATQVRICLLHVMVCDDKNENKDNMDKELVKQIKEAP